jgi:hypothetical protein
VVLQPNKQGDEREEFFFSVFFPPLFRFQTHFGKNRNLSTPNGPVIFKVE